MVSFKIIFYIVGSVLAADSKYINFPGDGEFHSRSIDSIVIYREGSFIRKNILMKKDELPGTLAEIVFTKDYIDHSGVKIYYKDYSECLKDIKCNEKLSSFPFLSYVDGSLFLKIDRYKNGMAVIDNIKSSLFFLIDSSYLESESNSYWRQYLFPQEKKVTQEQLLAKLPSLSDFLSKIKKCSFDKDIACLKRYSDSRTAGSLETIIRRRATYEDKKLCAEVIKENQTKDLGDGISKGILARADLNNNAFWNSLTKAVTRNPNDTILIYEIKDFNKELNVKIRNRLPKEMECGNQEDLILGMDVYNGKWELNEITAFEFYTPDGNNE